MAKYARGTNAYGFCAKTGFRYPMDKLRYEIVNGKRTGRRIGYDQVDPDHPQNYIGEVDTNDAQALFDPRPDVSDDGYALLSGQLVLIDNSYDEMQANNGKFLIRGE